MARKRKSYHGFKFIQYNELFEHQGKTWKVIHRTDDIKYAVELSNKGIAQGAIERFPI